MDSKYAHSLPASPKTDWHSLASHLSKTGERAEQFAQAFAPGWGYLAGIWHDAGKYLERFQRRIDNDANASTDETVDHACVGALLSEEKKFWKPLAFVIAGHHAGLPNRANLDDRLKRKFDSLAESRRDGLPTCLEQQSEPSHPPLPNRKTTVALWTRFLFSALVDADFLDTEAFYKERDRDPSAPQFALLLTKLEGHLGKFHQDSPMNELRARVLEHCRNESSRPPGFFTLTVPTGGGKTLSSMLFALRHASLHKLKRVIIVIPYTSIIDQTAKVYREIFGEGSVLEHHSNVDPVKETADNRLASENWDAPIVVTTSVQFFESLYANRTSRCRKLHNIAQSVVIFDEVQTFPANLLEPVKESLRNLVASFGVSVVLCTATQPALGFEAHEIVSDHKALFRAVAGRVEIHMPMVDQPTSFEKLAHEIVLENQVLAIVHRRDDAAALAQLVPDSIHLSARMCAAHRVITLASIRDRLRDQQRCCVISTQLVEAGVDLDFPVVYRAFAGADSMAQAAGRCNREGRNSSPGQLRIFLPPTDPPAGILRIGQQRALVMRKQGILNLLDPETFVRYFQLLYGSTDTDARGVLTSEKEFRFEDSAANFQLIEDGGIPIVVPYENAASRIAAFDFPGNLREKLRRLQPFLVTVHKQEFDTLMQVGAIHPLGEKLSLYQLTAPFHHLYSPRLGLTWSGSISADPLSLIG